MTPVKLIAVLSKKGGVGKTLISMGLAQALSASGHSVAVMDHDPEGSATGWGFNASERGVTLPYRVIAPVDALNHTDLAYLVVDTPPNDVPTLQQVATRAEYIVIPVLPGAGEVDRLQETVAALASVQAKLRPGVQIGFVLNRMENNKLSAVMPEVMQNLSYPVIAQVPRSVEYQRSFGGLIPDHLTEPFAAVLKELEISA
ncbi:AAA family ATPase [Deinococcus sp.]|uniref:nucleotide-binding protein n=1 Tax=Deinococcus sp. TaxID=47478 RepID=UPI003B5B6747